VRAVRLSGLLDDQFLSQFIDEFEINCPVDCSSDEKVRNLVNKFLGETLLTRWQCGKLMLGKHKGFIFGHYLLREYLGVHVTRKDSEAYVARDLRETNLEVVLEFPHFRQDLQAGREPEFSIVYQCRFMSEPV